MLKRKEEVVKNYREQSNDFLRCFQELQGHYEAIHGEVKRLRHQAARAEVLNIDLSDRIKDGNNEVRSMKNKASVQEEQMRGFLEQLQPPYTRPLDFSDIAGVDSGEIFNGPGVDPHSQEALDHAVFGNQRDVAFQWAHSDGFSGSNRVMRGNGASEGPTSSESNVSSVYREGFKNAGPTFLSSSVDLTPYIEDGSSHNTTQDGPPPTTNISRALRGQKWLTLPPLVLSRARKGVGHTLRQLNPKLWILLCLLVSSNFTIEPTLKAILMRL